MPDAPRCEPPEGWREKDGWHWLHTPTHGPALCKWTEHRGVHGDWRWRYENGHDISDAALEACGWRYLMPVPAPSDIKALVEAARWFNDAAKSVDDDNLRDATEIWEHSSAMSITAGDLRALRAALEPFKETGR